MRDRSQVTEELDIDLRQAGMMVGKATSEYSGHQFADDALSLNSKPVAVVEAKNASKSAERGQERATQFLRGFLDEPGPES